MAQSRVLTFSLEHNSISSSILVASFILVERESFRNISKNAKIEAQIMLMTTQMLDGSLSMQMYYFCQVNMDSRENEHKKKCNSISLTCECILYTTKKPLNEVKEDELRKEMGNGHLELTKCRRAWMLTCR